MSNPNPTPRPENLTRAGMGRVPRPNKMPKLYRVDEETTLIIEAYAKRHKKSLGDALDAIVKEWFEK